MADWESIFKRRGIVFKKQQEDVAKLIKFLKKNNVKRVLDLGCGTGRQAIALAKHFDLYISDISKTGLDITEKRLKQRGLKAKSKRFNCYKKFPYKKDFFDAVISVQVINHGYHREIKNCIKEIERVLKPSGYAFVTSSKSSYKNRATIFKKVAPRTCVMLDGEEKGVPHFVYNYALLRKDFKNFKILDLHIDSRSHYVLFARKK